MEEIIPAVPASLVGRELTPDKRMRTTNKSRNELYVVTADNAPHVMREIGRLREIAFRTYGGGTGTAIDIDEFDTMPNGYRQLIVWSPDEERILGGYRFLCGSDVQLDDAGQPRLATSHLFRFSERFISQYLPYTVELGRSFVTLEYQVTGGGNGGKKGIFILDNLWDGLGALSVIDPTLKYFFGKATMYVSYHREARNMVLYFLRRHFPDPDGLILPHVPLPHDFDDRRYDGLFPYDNFRENYRILNQEVRKFGANVPPLINAYMSLSPKMRVFGTTVNNDFGDVEETGIFISIDEILEEKKRRHIDSYLAAEICPTELIRNGT
jgi:hypothetical protein